MTAGFTQSFVHRKQSGSFLSAGNHLVARVGEPLRLCFKGAVEKAREIPQECLEECQFTTDRPILLAAILSEYECERHFGFGDFFDPTTASLSRKESAGCGLVVA